LLRIDVQDRTAGASAGGRAHKAQTSWIEHDAEA